MFALVWFFTLALSTSTVPGAGQTVAVQVGPFAGKRAQARCEELAEQVSEYVPGAQVSPCVAQLAAGVGAKVAASGFNVDSAQSDTRTGGARIISQLSGSMEPRMT